MYRAGTSIQITKILEQLSTSKLSYPAIAIQGYAPPGKFERTRVFFGLHFARFRLHGGEKGSA